VWCKRLTDGRAHFRQHGTVPYQPRILVTIHSIHQGSGVHMVGTTWQHRLDAARGAEEIVAAARDYLASFGPLELAALPDGCRPPRKIVDADDVTTYAFELVRFECEVHDTRDLVHKLARFFSHASMRLAQITARDPIAADDDDRRSA